MTSVVWSQAESVVVWDPVPQVTPVAEILDVPHLEVYVVLVGDAMRALLVAEMMGVCRMMGRFVVRTPAPTVARGLYVVMVMDVVRTYYPLLPLRRHLRRHLQRDPHLRQHRHQQLRRHQRRR